MGTVESLDGPFIIETITAFLAVDDNGAEGIVACLNGDMWTPLICSSGERMLLHMREMAQMTATASQQAIREVTFTTRTVVGVVEPGRAVEGSEMCGYEWELKDPNDEDIELSNTHKCYMASAHHGHHVCTCGASPEDDAPVCEACGAVARWFGNHWQTEHELHCTWMGGREMVRE